MEKNVNKNIHENIIKLSSELNYDFKEAAVILAAGHGKRIKSQTSKMLHKIWEIPTVERVYNASVNGIDRINIIIVVGIKAYDVMSVIGRRKNSVFAYQESQNGTGHAVQVALEKLDRDLFDGIIYVLPGDMGLIDAETMRDFRGNFLASAADMMVLTGIYKGDPLNNSYGRIVRVKNKDYKGKSSGRDEGKVIQIIEYKDILALEENEPYILIYNNREYAFSRSELIETNEFNSGVYAFKYKILAELIGKLSSDNVQKEIYITDLISLFNNHGYSVSASSPEKPYVVMGFNNKSVLKEMDAIARSQVYEKLKDIIEISDPEDFFIHESVVNDILEMDKIGTPLDINIGKGVYIGKDVKLNYNITFNNGCYVDGNVQFGQNIHIFQNVHLSCFPAQTLKIGNHVEILWGDIIKGNIVIGEQSRIESSVNMTGSDEFPVRIGRNVLIKGTSYIFGSIIEDYVHVEHSVIIRKKVKAVPQNDGSIKPVRFYLPPPEGVDAIENI
ncbi:MAG TPA: NTP transferase domain-containing protein [Ignavibacteriaceae bacterium]|nr:NTP transferase domain-containing protein [Ignavibacteriaceae bacterium]